jgi:hypothetical protein
MHRHRPYLAICIKKTSKRENVKIFVGEQVHIGNINTKENSDFEIGLKVVDNEKDSGSGRWQMMGISLGPW